MDIKEMKVRLKEEFTIALEANPTTGYIWEEKFDGTFLELKDKSFDVDPFAGIGGGGKHKLTFTPIKKGETEITMRYRRPWENKAIKKKTFRIKIKDDLDSNPGGRTTLEANVYKTP